MSEGAKSVLEAFDALPEEAREEVLAELIRRVAQSDHDSPSDDELVSAADRVFSEYDRSENES
jgi:hypothetical protein